MIGCACAVCESTAPEDKRFRASIVVTHDDGTQVLVDTTPDLRSQALACQLTRVDAVVYTHSHADHIFGLDELRRFIALKGGGTLTVYGDAHTVDELRRIFAYAFSAPAELGGGRAAAACPPSWTARSRWRARAGRRCPILHGRRQIFGYRIGGFAYLTDCSHVPDAVVGAARGTRPARRRRAAGAAAPDALLVARGRRRGAADRGGAHAVHPHVPRPRPRRHQCPAARGHGAGV